MSTTKEYLREKYGAIVTTRQLAEILQMKVKSLQNSISAGRLEIPTFRLGGRRMASVDHVAKHLDAKIAGASVQG